MITRVLIALTILASLVKGAIGCPCHLHDCPGLTLSYSQSPSGDTHDDEGGPSEHREDPNEPCPCKVCPESCSSGHVTPVFAGLVAGPAPVLFGAKAPMLSIPPALPWDRHTFLKSRLHSTGMLRAAIQVWLL